MQAWSVITAWIAEHSPREHALIRPPAPEERLRDVEQALGRPLPPQLAAWWRRADGIAGQVRLIPPMSTPCSTERALRVRATVLADWNGVQRDSDPERFDLYVANAESDPAGSHATVWLPSFLPVAGTGPSAVFTDLRPGPMHGCLGEFASQEGIRSGVAWNNVAHMLVEIAAAMRHGIKVRGHRLCVNEDGIDWR